MRNSRGPCRLGRGAQACAWPTVANTCLGGDLEAAVCLFLWPPDACTRQQSQPPLRRCFSVPFHQYPLLCGSASWEPSPGEGL